MVARTPSRFLAASHLTVAGLLAVVAVMTGAAWSPAGPVAGSGQDVPTSAVSSGPPARRDLSAQDSRRVAAATQPTRDFTRPEPFEAMSGGAGTSTAAQDRNVLTHAAGNMGPGGETSFQLGSALFEKLWVSSPSSTQASDGLGPLYNARACETCHVRDGRARSPVGEGSVGKGSTPGLVLQLSTAHHAGHSHVMAVDPVYGRQLQDSGVPGLPGEGRVSIRAEPQPVHLAGGETIILQRPVYGIEDLAYGPMEGDTRLSPRLAPAMTGLGLLEAIHPDDILAHADPQDRDGDGVSGRASLLPGASGDTPVLGRFGWKAQAASVRAQAAMAFATDIGISTSDVMKPQGDCTDRQPACLALEDGVQPRLGTSEAPEPVLDLVAFYARHLSVPARRDVGAPAVLAGKRLFSEIGCATCHVPKFVTRRDAVEPAAAFQLIWPYSDLLLHDMGAGLADRTLADRALGNLELAHDDSRDVGEDLAREWRTPPLWGIGLAGTVDRRAGFLHDGRARTLTEAVLWHGGEAQAARDRFVSLDAADRRALIAFLESL
jgi:CxxC motif-containing protein (DUF1111 family)